MKRNPVTHPRVGDIARRGRPFADIRVTELHRAGVVGVSPHGRPIVWTKAAWAADMADAVWVVPS